MNYRFVARQWPSMAIYRCLTLLGLFVPPPLQCLIHSLQARTPAPILWLPLEERTHGAEITLVAEEVSLLLAFTPEPNGIAERVHRLPVAANERPAKVYVGEVMDLRLQVSNLADVVRYGIEQRP